MRRLSWLNTPPMYNIGRGGKVTRYEVGLDGRWHSDACKCDECEAFRKIQLPEIDYAKYELLMKERFDGPKQDS